MVALSSIRIDHSNKFRRILPFQRFAANNQIDHDLFIRSRVRTHREGHNKSVIPTDEVIRAIAAFAPNGDGGAAKSRDLILALLQYSPEPLSRLTFTPGHITCTGVVLGPAADRVLLVHHRRLNRWLLPGGHVEAHDASIVDVARREVIEETGAQLDECVPGRLVGVDVHPIPPKGAEPLHLHHDLIFSFRSMTEESHCSPESRAVLWCGLLEFDRFQLPGSIRRAIERALLLDV
jgi:8-oxo-dGTP pyrophosphatase MutT (NUDIX family)